ncbi:DUF6597 domain-containing transcriptional factor [Paraflavitalea speifideaquila]|uniref:DUF6597 domain-containing transcriptional factor n=1 Tax=Paraflavitalea speifideaquila TaxID=3076558 RepID=UPI0028EC3CA9|nr:DUF6597 domain-containing transcriptional factor [Paraflavitalea speifideiaquila]
MLHQEFEPPEALRDSIKCFWYNQIELGEQESSFEVLPDGYAEIIFHFGSPCSVYNNGSLQPLPSPLSWGCLISLFFLLKKPLRDYWHPVFSLDGV